MYTYQSGGIFEPVAEAFNTFYASNATTTIEVTYIESNIWIENNSTNINVPLKVNCFTCFI